jgi:hypothetical protein
MTMQNIWQHHFPQPYRGRGVLMDKLAHGGSGNSNTFEFDENYRFFTTSCDT